MDVLDDLAAEYADLAAVLGALDDKQWQADSGAAGWSVADVLLHLAQTNEMVVATCSGRSSGLDKSSSVDEAVERWVEAERAPGPVVLRRWRESLEPSLAALRGADPNTHYPWADWPLRPMALATTRIAEHWAHRLDIADPLGIPCPDTDRLRHVAWLAHRTLPYGLAIHGHEAVPVRCELVGPNGDLWLFGPADAATMVTGSAGGFCRVAARRLAPAESGLIASGPAADEVLAALRSYAA
jgi:uncharacterized protein (TIGR03084 family)